MPTVLDNLKMAAEEVRHELDNLLRGSLIEAIPTEQTRHLLIVGCSFWSRLPPEGQQRQAKVLAEYRHYAEIARLLLSDAPERARSDFAETDRIILAAIEQTGTPRGSDPAAVFQEASSCLDKQIGLLAGLYSANGGRPIYVPDTNAILANPSLEDWRFGVPQFTIALLPTVTAELDSLKVNHRNEDVRKKAEGAIRRIKGYRSRGRLADGVPLKTGVSDLRAYAVEPDFRKTLAWLDSTNADDRFLASFLEVMRKHPHSAVWLVTLDLNMQNKAEVARLPFLEPPPP
jgi:hypothetical protein